MITRASPPCEVVELKNNMLGWPTLIGTWLFIVWFAMTICRSWKAPILSSSKDDGSVKLSTEWYPVLWVSVAPQMFFFFVYGMWLGWKFFMHN